MAMALTFLLWLLGGNNLLAKDQELSPSETQKTLQVMRSKLANIQTITADMKQRRVLALFSDELTSTAKLYVKLPEKVRWETQTPFRSLLLFNDHNAAKFEWKDAGWKKMTFGGGDIVANIMTQIMKWNQGDFSATDKTYELKVFRGPRIDLTPRADAQKKMLSKIELYPDPLTMRVKKTILREPKGDYVEISFSGYLENQSLGDPLFDLEHPQ